MTTSLMTNFTFDEIKIGQSATLNRVLTQKDIDLFAAVSGDVNPAHMDKKYADKTVFQGVIGHGMWAGGLISTVLGTMLPGPGTIYLGQELRFEKPVHLQDEIEVTLTVKAKHENKPVVIFDCVCRNEKNEIVLEGTATVMAPTEKITVQRPDVPIADIRPKDHYEDVLKVCRDLGKIRIAVVHPVQANVIQAVIEAVEEGLIEPVLVGPIKRIKEAAQENGSDISAFKILDTEHSHAAAAKAVELASRGEVEAIMKGSLHTDELLSAVVSSVSGLRTERRISHVYIMNVPTYHKPLMITDAAINIAPTLEEKADICRNAIDLWHVINSKAQNLPKVAILSAVETVTSRIPSTIDAAALCKMADRRQIIGADIDGPLAFDNAISLEAVKDKDIISNVAGDADILVVPNIESGNALAKQLIFLGQADAAGIVLGARVPIILTSRADSIKTRLLSCAVAIGLSSARKNGQIK